MGDALRHAQEPRSPANSGPVAQPHTAHHPFAATPSPSHLPASRASESSRFLPVPHTTNNQAGAGDQVALAAALTSQGHYNTYSAAPLSAWVPTTSTDWLPEGNFALAGSLPNDEYSTYAAGWQLTPHTSGPVAQQSAFDYQQQALPPRTRNSLAPTIRVTTGFPGFSQQTPQDTTYPSASSSSSLPLQEEQYFTTYQNTHLSPQNTRFMVPQPPNNMNAPVSPVSAHSPRDNATLPELLSRKRSHSQIDDAEAAPPPPPIMQSGAHSRAGSVASQPPNSASPAGEDYSPRGSRSFKRGDPPVNADSKYYCDFAPECADQTFDRKCEWR